MDDSRMAEAATIRTILRKRVFKETTSKSRKLGIEISPTMSVDGKASVASTKLEAEGLERAGRIEGNFISGLG